MLAVVAIASAAYTSAQIRIRVAVLLLLAFPVLSLDLEFDAILGAFLAGALLAAITDPERDEAFGHFRTELEAIGFGFFVPVFFVATGPLARDPAPRRRLEHSRAGTGAGVTSGPGCRERARAPGTIPVPLCRR